MSSPQPDPTQQSGHWQRNQLVYFTVGALILGIVLGGAFVALRSPSTSTEGGASPAPSVPAATSTPAPGDVQVAATVPVQCLEAADRASNALRTAQGGLRAIRDFDAAALRDVLRTLQDEQPIVQDLAQQCRDQASASASRAPSSPSS